MNSHRTPCVLLARDLRVVYSKYFGENRCASKTCILCLQQCYRVISWTDAEPCLDIKTVFPGMGIPMLKIRRSQDRLIFNMGIPILLWRHLYIEMAPSWYLPVMSHFFVISGLISGQQCTGSIYCKTCNRRLTMCCETC